MGHRKHCNERASEQSDAARGRERSTLNFRGQTRTGGLWTGVGARALERRDTQKSPRLSAWGSEVKVERKRDESVKEPVPETDPNGSREEKGGGGRLETDLWGEGKAALERARGQISERSTRAEMHGQHPAQEQESQLHVNS